MKITRTRVKILVASILIIAPLYLVGFTLVSTAHPTATAAIERSRNVADAVGLVKAILLVGVGQRLSPGGISCTRGTYLVLGSSGFSFVTASLSMRRATLQWTVDDLAVGWFSADNPGPGC